MCYPRFEHADTVIGGGENNSGPPSADEGEGEVNHEIPRGWHSAQTGAKPHSAQTGAKPPLEEEDAITWFHWNTRNTSFFNDTLRGPSSRKVPLILGPTKQVPATQCRVNWRHRACPGQIALFLKCFSRFDQLGSGVAVGARPHCEHLQNAGRFGTGFIPGAICHLAA